LRQLYWLDWVAAIVVVMFAVRGLRQGTVRQSFGLLGLLAGIWSLCAFSQWVGAHWQGARPAVVFWVLRWLVAVLAGLAAAALCQWWGEILAEGVKATGLEWLDRAGGFLFGAGIGACVVVAAFVVMLTVPWPREAARMAARSRSVRPALAGTSWLFAKGDRFIPGGEWPLHVLRDADRRLRLAARKS